MSGKRLTDAQVASGYERTPGAPSARSLRADHLQAREDVRRLAKRLRERQGGLCCEAARTQCEDCDGDLRLLAEVGK